MKWVEIIYLRSAGSRQKHLIDELKDQTEAIRQSPDITNMEIFHRHNLDSDLMIMIQGESTAAHHKENGLGLHLESLLKAFGLVNRSLWMEYTGDRANDKAAYGPQA